MKLDMAIERFGERDGWTHLRQVFDERELQAMDEGDIRRLVRLSERTQEQIYVLRQQGRHSEAEELAAERDRIVRERESR